MAEVQVDYPGLLKEKLPSGNYRYRVRVEGKPHRRVRLHIEPSHKDFSEHYRAARAGREIKPEATPVEIAQRGSVAWLTHKHIESMEKMVDAGVVSPLTLKKRRSMMKRLRKECGNCPVDMPSLTIVTLRDEMAATPAQADNLVSAVKSLYKWACDRGYCSVNPAIGVAKIDKGKGGAKAWTVDDFKTYREKHPPGTAAHLCLTLFMFTACRIGDAVLLGRGHEEIFDGMRWLRWQPVKKGSAEVFIPMLPPLLRATRASTVIGDTYLLTEYGRPFRSPEGLRNRLRKWCNEAKLPLLSSHGIRKGAGHLLAQEGCSQYQIMCVHGHTQAKTSEVYTKGVERARMAAEAMKTLESMEW